MSEFIEIPPFYVGQEVVATKTHGQGIFKRGDDFVVLGIKKSGCGCGHWVVDIGVPAVVNADGEGLLHCHYCRNLWVDGDGVWWLNSNAFAPKVEWGEFIPMREVVESAIGLYSSN